MTDKTDISPRPVCVRFAPSPTGPLHIGGVRTALFNYLFARRHGGKMILRIEDTDSTRFVPGAEDYINEALDWLGIGIDEGVRQGGPHGPYRQSQRRHIYKKYVDLLLEQGKAYIAFDTPEELAAAREATPNFQYDASTRAGMRNSLSMDPKEVEALLQAGTQYVVRIKITPGQEVKVHDLVRGEVSINSSVLDDKVLYKSADSLPTYHLANIVDDHLMEVTHVIRGEEWLPSAPLHVLLYRALGWEDTMPAFVHLPLLLKPVGNGKLSKRDGDKLGFPVFPLDWRDPKTGALSPGYREQGYLPQAVVNFLALLGWNPGDDTEIMSMQQLIDKFSFEHCSRSGAKFDYKKAAWFNHEYLKEMDDEALAALFMPILEEHGVHNPDHDYVRRVVAMVKGRIDFPRDLWREADFFFRTPEEYAEKDVKKRWKPGTGAIMRRLMEVLRSLPSMDAATAEAAVLDWIKQNDMHLGNVMNAFRLSVVGACRGPHMFLITELMPLPEVLARMQKAIDELGN